MICCNTDRIARQCGTSMKRRKNISSDIFHFFIYDLLPLIFNGIAHSVPTEKRATVYKTVALFGME